MREIKFRGQTTSNKEWVYGSLITLLKRRYISNQPVKNANITFENLYKISQQVIPKTVGQFSDVEDMDGKDIYEKDILGRSNGIIREVVCFKDGMFCVYNKYGIFGNTTTIIPLVKWVKESIDGTKIIGNTPQNLNLLENGYRKDLEW